MHLYEKKRAGGFRGLIVSALVLIAILGLFAYALVAVSGRASDERQAALEEAVHRALITCYATEGQYPPTIDYLVAHYALTIDEDYIVSYDAFASNILPTVTIYRRGDAA
jgi:hypothetical protein